MTIPIDPATLGAFLLAVSALVLSPGPDTVIILRYTLSSGTRVGLAAVAGVQVGLMLHTVLAILGVSALIASSPIIFKTVAAVGALYIAWIGLQGFREGGLLDIHAAGKGISQKKAFRDAVMCNLLNPKVIILFLALFPSFVDVTRDDLSLQLMVLGLVLILVNSLWQVPLALAAEAIRRWLLNPLAYKLVTRGTGVVLIVIAGLMVYENLLA